jgi:hypothetical protein
VKFELRVGGGLAYLPGLAAPLIVDTAALPAEERQALERLVVDASVFDQPSSPKVATRGADQRTYTLTVDDGSRKHTVRLSDPVGDPALATLLQKLQGLR